MESSNIKNFCNDCNKQIQGSVVHFRRHLDVHQKIKRFLCKYCHKRLSSKYTLDQHIKRQHENVEEAHPCSHCSKVFISKQGKLNHEKCLHTENSTKRTQNSHNNFVLLEAKHDNASSDGERKESHSTDSSGFIVRDNNVLTEGSRSSSAPRHKKKKCVKEIKFLKTRFCPKCGENIDSGYHYCISCGYNVFQCQQKKYGLKKKRKRAIIIQKRPEPAQDN